MQHKGCKSHFTRTPQNADSLNINSLTLIGKLINFLCRKQRLTVKSYRRNISNNRYSWMEVEFNCPYASNWTKTNKNWRKSCFGNWKGRRWSRTGELIDLYDILKPIAKAINAEDKNNWQIKLKRWRGSGLPTPSNKYSADWMRKKCSIRCWILNYQYLI